jgi:DNA-binding MarR family transcriptional regulator
MGRIADSVRALRKLGIDSMAEAAVFCEAASTAESTLGSIARTLTFPVSTVSRVAYALEQRGLVRYEPHPTDRRKKFLRANVSG